MPKSSHNNTAVGKSTLLTTLTGTYSVAADYEFTTLTTVPGIIRYQVSSTSNNLTSRVPKFSYWIYLELLKEQRTAKVEVDR